MDDKKAEDIRIINLKKIENSVTDYFVLATGNSNIHVDSIADGIQEDVLKKFNERPWKKEGIENREWILIDFVNVVAHIFDERNDAVKKMIKMAIESCKKNNVKIGICGQGPSDYPDFAQFLVENNIDTISVTPDAVLKTYMAIYKVERSLK